MSTHRQRPKGGLDRFWRAPSLGIDQFSDTDHYLILTRSRPTPASPFVKERTRPLCPSVKLASSEPYPFLLAETAGLVGVLPSCEAAAAAVRIADYRLSQCGALTPALLRPLDHECYA